METEILEVLESIQWMVSLQIGVMMGVAVILGICEWRAR